MIITIVMTSMIVTACMDVCVYSNDSDSIIFLKSIRKWLLPLQRMLPDYSHWWARGSFISSTALTTHVHIAVHQNSVVNNGEEWSGKGHLKSDVKGTDLFACSSWKVSLFVSSSLCNFFFCPDPWNRKRHIIHKSHVMLRGIDPVLLVNFRATVFNNTLNNRLDSESRCLLDLDHHWNWS